jgi:hypothetical protein
MWKFFYFLASRDHLSNMLMYHGCCRYTKKGDVEWANTCTPHPNPTDKIAEGADHDPSSLRATTRPVPTLYVRTAPALATVRTARPFAPLRIDEGMDFSGFNRAT